MISDEATQRFTNCTHCDTTQPGGLRSRALHNGVCAAVHLFDHLEQTDPLTLTYASSDVPD